MANKISTVIVDDEKNNIEFLEALLSEFCPQLSVIATAEHASAAFDIIREKEPQLVFMDIDMPGMTGFELLKKMEPVNFEVIFVTAYDQYATDAFDYNAVAYITKPVITEKLIAAVERALQRIEKNEQSKNIFTLLENAKPSNTADRIPLPTLQGFQFVKLHDICYCESSGNYTSFHLPGAVKILVSRQLGEYEKLLPAENFVRIHDKYIINLSCISEYIKGAGGEIKLEDGTVLPVASRRKEEFLSRFDKWLRRR